MRSVKIIVEHVSEGITMGLHFRNDEIATGLAKCKVCNEIIKKGTKCIYVSGWQTSGHCHKNCPGGKNGKRI